MATERASAAWARQVYGVDIAGDDTIVVRARRGARGVRTIRFRMDAEHPSAVGRRTAIAVALPPRESLAVWVRAPSVALRKARRVFPTLLDIQLPFPLEDCIADFVGAARVDKGPDARVEALGVAARRTDLDRRLAVLAARGLDPHVVDTVGVALWDGSFEAAPASASETGRVVVYLAGDATVVAGRDGRYGGVQSVTGADPTAIDRFLLAQLGGDWRRRVNGVAAGADVPWIWCGPGAEDRAVVERLQAALALPARVQATIATDPRTFLARALAVRALRPGALRCNLRAGDRAHPAVTRRATLRLALAATTVLVAGLALIGGELGARVFADRHLAAMQRACRVRASEVAGYPVDARGADAVQIVEHEVDRQLAVLRPFRAMLAPSLLQKLISAVRGVGAAEGCTLQSLTVSGDELELTVHASTPAGLDNAVQQLRAAGCPVRRVGEPSAGEGAVTQLLAWRSTEDTQ